MKKIRLPIPIACICLVLVFIASTMLVACTSTETTSPTTAASGVPSSVPVSILECPQGPPASGLTPQYGGIYKIIYPDIPTNLGAPWKIASVHDHTLNRFAIEKLIGQDTNGNPAPQLAASWETDPVNKTVTINLRQGVKFHDGTDFNAEAAKWNLEAAIEGESNDIDRETTVDIIDDYTILVTFPEWDPLVLQNWACTGIGWIVSPAAASQMGNDALLNPVGTGPFKFVSYERNVSLEYERFDDYWQEGLPYLDGVEIKFVDNPVVALTSFERGEAHALRGVPTGDASSLAAKGNTIHTNTSAIVGICGNTKSPESPFADIRVRQAFAYAIPIESIVDTIFDGMYPVTYQLALEGQTGYNSEIVGYPYDPDKARELLDQAGYGPDNPLTMELTYVADPQRADLYATIQSYLGKVDVNITLDPVVFAAFSRLRQSGWEENQLLQGGFSYGGMTYSQSLIWNLAPGSQNNVSILTPPEFDALYETMLDEGDLAQREEYYKQLNKMAVDDYCLFLPMYGWEIITVKAPEVKDCGFGHIKTVEFLPERVWLSN